MQPVRHVDELGNVEWFIENKGKRHREDGPAVECANGDKLWYRRGALHREDGPAIERQDGTVSWYIESREVLPHQMPLQLFIVYMKWMKDRTNLI